MRCDTSISPRENNFMYLILASLLAAASATERAAPPPVANVQRAEAPSAPGPASLQQRINALAEPFDSRSGVAVQSVEDRWTVGVNTGQSFQQQSVFKTWVAAAALDAIDRGSLRWDEPIRIEPADLIFPYQPIAKEVPPEGRAFTVEELVRWSVIHSDNPSVDALLTRLGGPAAVQATLKRIGVNGIRIDVGERDLHAMFDQSRSELAAAPAEQKADVFERIFSDPRNSATPAGTVDALARLQRGELLSPLSTERLLGIMAKTGTGLNRLKAGTPAGWTLAHKTGTGGDLDGATNGTNNIGVMTAPNGRRYAVAVFIWGARRPLAENERLMADVAKAVAEWETARAADSR